MHPACVLSDAGTKRNWVFLTMRTRRIVSNQVRRQLQQRWQKRATQLQPTYLSL
jgi:hypothetical protein